METKKWGLWVLTAFVIGNMVGGGVFMLPANLAQVSGPMGSYTCMEYYRTWRIYDCTRIWKFSNPKTRIKSGATKLCPSDVPFKKAGKVAGYSMAWGYWAANWAATASVIISFAGYLSTFFPVLQSKQILFQRTDFH